MDVDFCCGLIDFLRYAKNGVRKDGSVISNGAAHHHQAVLNGALNKAVRDGMMSANPLKSISSKKVPDDRKHEGIVGRDESGDGCALPP